ncbi:hypothetical protein F2Q69_00030360 [Brassica cretica]|uniref:Uncharacterized protein n=1 Tax=Brassica cretica TaxID=69181 RepID=A0A8S9S6B4_BRACR|nr:hypothetical protein F2Q69_00030360 [Brassica cretica]
MEGSPYRKFSFSRGKGAVPDTGPGALRSGEPGYLLAETQKLVSCLGSGEIQYLNIFPQQFAPYCSISSSNSGITCALKSTGVAHSQQASLRQDIAPMKKLWASDGVLETAEPGSLMFPGEEAQRLDAWK